MRSCSASAACSSCSHRAGGSTSRRTSRRCCACRARCARSPWRSSAPTDRACRRCSTPRSARTTRGDRSSSAPRSSTRPTGAATSRSCSTRAAASTTSRWSCSAACCRARCRRRRELDLDVAYRPGVSGLEVGGDWYDAFWLTDGETVALAVGDVVGRGLGAAATMGQLRSALRALAAMELGPGTLLEALDRYACLHEVGRMTTVVYCELDLATGRLRYACAGHPPPVVVRPGEGPSVLWGGRSTAPRRVSPGPRSTRRRPRASCRRAACSCSTPTGSSRTASSRCRRASSGSWASSSSMPRPPPGPLVAQLVHALHGSENTDDTCVLAARLREAAID